MTPSTSPASGRRAPWLVVVVVAAGAGLRFWAITRAPANPFYDAAVRSMGLSWHNFFFGSLEPGGSVSIDKPPADLWIQVVSTKLLGFTTFALHLPEALCGTAAVALLYAAVASVWGRRTGILAALALTVLPISVLTSRSDTMDSVMTALLIAALWASIRALQTRRVAWVLISAGLVGVAFNVKLAQALVPLPAFVVMWAAAVSRRRRAPVLLGAAATLVVVGMSWIVIASLTPTAQRPHPIGSGNGSIYRVVFVFNGLDRITAKGLQLGPSDPTPPGPLRLVSAGGDYAELIGGELVATLALGLAVLATMHRRRGWTPSGWTPRGIDPASCERRRVVRWTAVGLGLWVAVAVVLFSAIGHLQTRYLETASPALAAVLGICAAGLLGRAGERGPARALSGALLVAGVYAIALASDSTGRVVAGVGLALALAGLLLAGGVPAASRSSGFGRLVGTGGLGALVALAVFGLPLRVSVSVISDRATDAAHGDDGAGYSAYLLSHRDGARYEVASDDTLGVVGVVSADGQPVVVLDDTKGPLVRVATLRRLVGRGAVRYVLLDHPCSGASGCPSTTRWSVRHSVKVRGDLYRYDGV